jgi:hypothetical protein
VLGACQWVFAFFLSLVIWFANIFALQSHHMVEDLEDRIMQELTNHDEAIEAL